MTEVTSEAEFSIDDLPFSEDRARLARAA